MKIRAISGAMLAALSLAALPAVAASNSLTFQGVTFNTYALDADTLKLEILNATSATGNWAGVNWLKAFEIKDIGNVTAASIFSVTGNQPAFFPALFVLTRMPSWHHGMESRHGDDDQEVAGEARRGAVAG
uniref:hypothetical protein n=1 Tax=Accumulibacter sp. TaxID=2053492 RepID=UPI0035B474C5